MTNEQILKKAITKAVKNGWGSIPMEECDNEWLIEILEDKNYYSTIFSHAFAEAFWGDEKVNYINPKGNEYVYVKYLWQYHLQQLALKKQPLKYIEKFLKVEK